MSRINVTGDRAFGNESKLIYDVSRGGAAGLPFANGDYFVFDTSLTPSMTIVLSTALHMS